MRALLGALVGYIATGAVVVVSLSAAYLALGADRAFEPESWAPSLLWVGLMLFLGAVAALLGGRVSRKIGGEKSPLVLAGVVLVLGGLSAAANVVREPPADRPATRVEDVGGSEAMVYADQPLWFAIANPLVAVVGVLLGGRDRRQRA